MHSDRGNSGTSGSIFGGCVIRPFRSFRRFRAFSLPSAHGVRSRATAACLALLAAPACASHNRPPTLPAPAPQNTSPMVEATRTHERLTQRPLAGVLRTFAGPRGRPVELLITEEARGAEAYDLVVHFHGAAWLPEQA